MKNFLLKAIILAVIAGFIYLFFLAVMKIDSSKVCVVEDLRSKKIIRVVHPSFGSYAFIWQGAFPWWFVVSEEPTRRIADFRVKIPVPELASLKEEYFHVWAPVRVTYRIDWKSFSGISGLGDHGRGLDALIATILENAFQHELGQYLSPAYQREAAAKAMAALPDNVIKKLEKEFKSFGLLLDSAAIEGRVLLPDRTVVNEGIQHAADLRKIDKETEKGLIELRSRMERDKIQNEQTYKNLLEISRIITANPDILKYIYIDKMAGNVKVILSPDDTGIPRMFENERKPAKGKPKEIDNLRQ